MRDDGRDRADRGQALGLRELLLQRIELVLRGDQLHGEGVGGERRRWAFHSR
jgi:hypothetical protein